MPKKISRKRNLTSSQSNSIFKVKKVGDKMANDNRKRLRIDQNKVKYDI